MKFTRMHFLNDCVFSGNLRTRLSVLIILFFASAHVFSQLFYTNTFAPSWQNGKIQRVEHNFTFSTVVTLNGRLGDIAISPSGTMYGINASVIYKVNLENGELSPLDTLPFGDWSSSLVASHDYHLYTLARSGVLYAYDILGDSLKLIDYLGALGLSAEDIAFYRGNIITQGYNARNFYAYNLEKKTITWVICNSIPGYEMNAISTVVDSCGDEILYGITSTDGIVYQINIDNNSLTQLHIYGAVNFSGYGMATLSEHVGSSCSEQLPGCNLVADKSPPQQPMFTFYPNPVTNFLFISSDQEIEKVKIYTSDGKLVKSFENPIFPIDVQNLEKGIYFLQISIDGRLGVRTVLIQ